MADKSPIEWTDATWNPIGGCSRVDEGCRNCYAEIMAARFSGPGQWGEDLAQIVTSGGKRDHRWTGKLRLNEAALQKPLRWRKPRMIFVNSTSDLFHEDVPDAWIDQVFAVMALAPQHTFQVLTKRPERMRAYLGNMDRTAIVCLAVTMAMATAGFTGSQSKRIEWPLPNVWLGTSISDQASADLRISILAETPAAVRFVSAEPLLGPVKLNEWDLGLLIHWLICGGESGPGARPMHPDWARSLRDQCTAAGVPFFFKQWGEWRPATMRGANGGIDGAKASAPFTHLDGTIVCRVGKASAGRLLDGREWNEMPGVKHG